MIHRRDKSGTRILTALVFASSIAAACSTADPGGGTERLQDEAIAQHALCDGSERPQAQGFDAATRHDAAFNAAFRHCFATARGVQLHYVIGGAQSAARPLVLIHGWPQSWFEWRGLLSPLASQRLVIAVDLPGLGDSSGSPPTLDKATLATFLHGLISERLGYSDIDIAAHDLGAGVGFAYAARYPAEVARLAVMDFPLPGPGCPEPQIRQLSYHFSFFEQPGIPELLIDDAKLRPFLEAFYAHVTVNPEPIAPPEVTEYVRTYRRDEVRHNGFELYRTLAKDEADDRALAAAPLTLPVLLLTQQFAFEFEASCYRPLVTQLSGTAIAGAGHWLNGEAPDVVLAQLSAFFRQDAPTR